MASRGEHSWFSMCVKLGLSAYMVAFGSRQLTQALGFREIDNQNSDIGLSCPNSLDCEGSDKFLELWESEWVRWLSMILSTQVTRFARKRMIDNATNDEGFEGLGDVVESPVVDILGTSMKTIATTSSEFWGPLGVGLWEAVWTLKIVPWMITDYKNTEIMSLKPKEPRAEKVKLRTAESGVDERTREPKKKNPEPFRTEREKQADLREDWEEGIHKEDMRKRRVRKRRIKLGWFFQGEVYNEGGVVGETHNTITGENVKTVDMEFGPYKVRVNVYDDDVEKAQVFVDKPDGSTEHGTMPLDDVGKWVSSL